MKLENLIPHRRTGRIIQQFGAARLIRNFDGSHNLVGGTRDDLAAAHEWVSLFAHEIVFSAASRRPTADCRAHEETISSRWRFA